MTNKLRLLRIVFLPIVFVLLTLTYLFIARPEPLRWIWPSIFFHDVQQNSLSLQLKWSYDSTKGIKLPPVANSQVVILLEKGDRLVALDNQQGIIKWTYGIPEGIFTPGLDENNLIAINEELVIFSSGYEQLVALNTQTGQEVWAVDYSETLGFVQPKVITTDRFAVVIAWTSATGGYFAGYSLENGSLAWEMPLVSKTGRYLFDCTDLMSVNSRGETVCIIPTDTLQIIDLEEQNPLVTGEYPFEYYSFDSPIARGGFLFANPRPGPANIAIDVGDDKTVQLPASCLTVEQAYPLTVFDNLLLIANGCNELYVLDMQTLEANPTWIIESSETLLSSFVTLDGSSGFVLNEEGQILEIDLQSGNIVGQFLTQPSVASRPTIGGWHTINSLLVNDTYLYALLEGATLFALQQEK